MENKIHVPNHQPDINLMAFQVPDDGKDWASPKLDSWDDQFYPILCALGKEGPRSSRPFLVAMSEISGNWYPALASKSSAATRPDLGNQN